MLCVSNILDRPLEHKASARGPLILDSITFFWKWNVAVVRMNANYLVSHPHCIPPMDRVDSLRDGQCVFNVGLPSRDALGIRFSSLERKGQWSPIKHHIVYKHTR